MQANLKYNMAKGVLFEYNLWYITVANRPLYSRRLCCVFPSHVCVTTLVDIYERDERCWLQEFSV